MTTNPDGLQIIFSPDLFQPNKSVNLARLTSADDHPRLAAITIESTPDIIHRSATIWACLGRATELILQGAQTYRPWLCACECGYDNRVARYSKLWKSLASKGFQPPVRTTPETSIENDDGTICFYGAAEIGIEKIESVKTIVTPSSRSFLAWLPSTTAPDIDCLVAMGWKRGPSDLLELRDIAIVLSKQGGIVLRPFGQFDDLEAGVDCIMDADIYAGLVSTMEGAAIA